MHYLEQIDEFKRFRQSLIDNSSDGKPCIVIGAGTCGQASGSNDLIRIIKRQILEQGLHNKISLRITGCLGFCEMSPFIVIEPGHNLYPKLRMENIPQIIDAALEDRVIEELLYTEPGSYTKCYTQQEIPFFKGQTRTILGQNQRLDPIRIVDYVKTGGYASLIKVLENPDPDWIIKEVLESKIRGRGGAGFPTGKKWEFARKSYDKTGQKFIVCNADEGDPGAYMDRSLLEGNPHTVLEGMFIAAIAIGAGNGIIYVRSEYPLAIKHSLIAIRQARDLGILGKNILGSGIDFDIEIFQGAGAFVCGEETALIKSIEGKMGEPRQRPPYPILKGIQGHPTCINNVETLANIPQIISKGAAEYAKIGTINNTGTKIFSLVGKIKNTGLVEVSLGTPISKVVYEIGGGPVGKAKIKAIQTGGPSGGCIPASMFDLPLDYDILTEVGSIMGSGGMIVMDENTCMVDVAKFFMNFLKDESCGKCFTCRKGTQRMYEILDNITRGKGTLAELELLEELAHVVKDTTMCGLGQTAANPVLSTLRYFRNEYEEHIVDKKCTAFVCKDLVGVLCQAACPLDTEPWRYIALIEKGEYEEAYKVIREANPLPSVCARICDRKCEQRCSLITSGGEPIAIRALKRFIADRVDPLIYRPERVVRDTEDVHEVAVIGAGPAGLSAAHYLSLSGYRVTIFEAEKEPGGMLITSIPAYRMPKNVVRRDIELLIDENIILKCQTVLGRDITIDSLFTDGFKAIFLAIGAHESRRLDIEGEDVEGIYQSIEFLKAFNLMGEELARGYVGIIGGGNSAVDAARVALRQKKVEKVTLFYRRTRQEMPAYEEEIEAALEEGVELELLVSPVKIYSKNKYLVAFECIRNKLGEMDSSGRRRPITVPGTEFKILVATLIVAIGERPQSNFLKSMGIEIDKSGRVNVDIETFQTHHPGVFAGGDLVTGPNTVVDAIAAGKKAALIIDRFIQEKELGEPPKVKLPEVLLEPAVVSDEELEQAKRTVPPILSVELRHNNFEEVEKTLSVDEAKQEARRCLRCDLEFIQHKNGSTIEYETVGEKQA